MRVFLWIVWVVLLTAAALSLAGLEPLQRVGDPSPVSAVLGIALSLSVFLVLLLSGRGPAARRLVATGVGRRARRQHGDVAVDLWPLLVSRARRGDSFGSPAEVIVDLRGRAAEGGAPSPRWPWEWREFAALARRSEMAILDSLLNRLLVPERSRELASFVGSVHHVIDSFESFAPVAADDAVATHSRLRAEIERFTGSLLLADALGTRLGAATGVRVWHSSRPADGRTIDGFREEHEAGSTAPCSYGVKMANSPGTRLDDFDGTVLAVRAVSTVRDTARGGIQFVLDTDTTCYAATDYAPSRCKHLGQNHLPLPMWTRSSVLRESSAVERGDSELASLVTVTGVLLVRTNDEDPSLCIILMKRPPHVRHGASTLALPGGVVVVGSGEAAQSVDDVGMPDLAAALSREVLEELGVRVDRRDWVIDAVALGNSRSSGEAVAAKADGSAVVTVLMSVVLDMTLADVARAQETQSTADGRYESEGVVGFRLTTDPAATKSDQARQLCTALERMAGTVDQRVLVSSMLLGARYFGDGEMLNVIPVVFGESDTWSRWWGPEHGARRLFDLDELWVTRD